MSTQGRAETEGLEISLKELEQQLTESRQGHEEEMNAAATDRAVLERALEDLEASYAEEREDKERLYKVLHAEKDRLSDMLNAKEAENEAKEVTYQNMRMQLIEREAEVAHSSKELRHAESRWAKQKALLVGEVEHLKQQGEMLLADLMSTTDTFQ